MTNIVRLGVEKEDNRFITPKELLELAIEDINNGTLDCNKMVILPLDDREGYHISRYAANIKSSEILALLARNIHSINKTID